LKIRGSIRRKVVANIKSAVKRHKQNLKRRTRNRLRKSRVKTHVKAVKLALLEKDIDRARELLPKAMREIHKAASKGALHKNNASRKISRLARLVDQYEVESG
jgi:small subunit ribosomal protein S20